MKASESNELNLDLLPQTSAPKRAAMSCHPLNGRNGKRPFTGSCAIRFANRWLTGSSGFYWE